MISYYATSNLNKMACGGTEPLSMDGKVTLHFLAQVAHKMYTKHLERFALIVAHLEDATYSNIISEAGDDSWKQCYGVLKAWHHQNAPTLQDLHSLLKRGEDINTIQKGTADEVCKSENRKEFVRPNVQLHCDFASNLRSWYTDPNWENLLPFPWMGDEWAFKLSEVYTELQIETYTGRGEMIEARRLKDSVELFTDMNSEGTTRILVKGDPGGGKTTFTHILAYDWATGCLELFDAVFVIKLKFTNREQTIEEMIVDQISNIPENASVAMVADYLKSGRDKVLLILDGLDEIPWKKYPKVKKVVQGEAYRKCCILLTTRPKVARIMGFTREKARKYVSRIIRGKQQQQEFFKQLDLRKMSGITRLPILLQALALLFNEDKKLAKSITSTYDQLLHFLRNTCKAGQGLSESELTKATDDVNELAFKGLIREDGQLIFDRDEIQNENIYKLGVLFAEKIGSGFNPREKFQFLHKTLQEHAASDHVVKRMKAGDWVPWLDILELFEKESNETNDLTDEGFEECFSEEPPYSTDVVQTAADKLFDALSADYDLFYNFMDEMAGASAFDEEFDDTKIDSTIINHPALNKTTDTEKRHLAIYFKEIFVKKASKEWKEQTKYWVQHQMRSWTSKIAIKGALRLMTWLIKYRKFGIENLQKEISTVQKRLKTSKGNFTYFKSHKTLFCFIIGKLPLELVPEVVRILNVLIVRDSYNEQNMDVARIVDLQSAMLDLVQQARFDDIDQILCDKYRFVHPALLSLGPSQANLPPSSEDIERTALQICGKTKQENSKVKQKKSKVKQDNLTLFKDITQEVRTLDNIHIAEISDVVELVDSSTQREFVKALCQSPIVSLTLDSVATGLVTRLLENVPPKLERLTVFCNDPNTRYNFLTVPNLKRLHLLNCNADLSSASFPKLKTFIVSSSPGWEPRDGDTLHTALTGHRMDQLNTLEIFFTSLRGSGEVFADILTVKTLKNVHLVGVKFSLDDGRVLLRSLREGKFCHLETLSLLNNKQLAPVATDFQTEGAKQNIEILINTDDSENGCMHRLKQHIARLFSYRH